MRLTLTSLFSLSLLVAKSYGICECGYRIRATNAYYTSVIISNFSSMSNARNLNTNAPDFSRDWVVQSWSAPPSKDHPISRINEESNVWIENGALVLRQRGYSEDDNQAGRNISCAEISSKRKNFGRVSARARFEVDVGDTYPRGGVAGFFWYYNDRNEVDIEVLTKEANDTTIHYTTHPALDANMQPKPLALYKTELKQTWRDPQTHRFDISPNNATYFVNNVSVHDTKTNIPAASVPGTILMNMWASGSEWSGFPSRENITMRVSNIVVFYNESGDPGLSSAAAESCRKAGGPEAEGAMCWDQDGAFGVRNAAVSLSAGICWVGLSLAVLFLTIL